MDLKLPSYMKLNGNLAENWHRFKQKFTLYMEATEKISKPDMQKIAILLTCMGEDCIEIFNSFKLNEEESKSYETVVTCFDKYFEPQKNTILARYKFFNCKQQQNETIDSFVTNLKNLAKDCCFESQEESLVRDLLIMGIRDSSVKEKLLMESSLSLDKAIDYCRAKASSEQQIKFMNEFNLPKSENVDAVKFKGAKGKEKYSKRFTKKSKAPEYNDNIKCSKCLTKHKYRNCPAWGKQCHKCHKYNHFASACKNKRIYEIENNVSNDNSDRKSETSFTLGSVISQVNTTKNEWHETIEVNGTHLTFKIDTGAEVNIIPLSKLHSLGKNIQIDKTAKELKSYTGHKLKVVGTCDLECRVGNCKEMLQFFIVDHNSSALIGLEASEKLKIIKRNFVASVDTSENIIIYEQYKDIFSGTIGTLPYTYDIKLDENAVPQITPARIIPISLKEKVKSEIDRMVTAGILKEIAEPTEWVHPIVIVQKPNKKVRICMDPRQLNKYIKREHYPIPTQQDIFCQLKGANCFSVLDASSAFLQIPLTEESSKLCTIATPFGRFRFCRLPYGLASSPEVFQKTIDFVFSGLEGIVTYIDDILVFGSTEKEHDERLKSVLERARTYNLKLTKDKCQIKVSTVEYLGYILSPDGISVNPEKIRPIVEYKTPKDKAELQRFLGMVTYLGRFIPNLSDKTGILRHLLSNKVEFCWSANEQKAFEELKCLITNAPVLAYFDSKKKTILSVDASKHGLGAVLLQDSHPIGYASVALTETQQKYSQIEKELLAIVNGCRKFHFYVYGINDLTIETDHKPLIGLLKKPLNALSPIIQKMMMELFKYQFDIVHVPGKHLYIADALSRAPMLARIDTRKYDDEFLLIHSVLTCSEEKTRQIQEETNKDPLLSEIKYMVRNGWPEHKSQLSPEIKPYWEKRLGLYIYEELLFYENRLIIPKAMQKEVLSKLHDSAHQGITSCQNKARDAIYWINLMNDIKKLVKNCHICAQHEKRNSKEPMIMSRIPSLPWEEIGIDFMYLEGENYLVVIDYHSKFVEIRKLNQKTAESVISALKQIFCTHGIPRKLYSDNGPPFESHQFSQFMNNYEIKHITSSPNYPKSNGMVERAIGTIKTILLKVKDEHGDPNLAILEYNNTPKYNLPTPAQMLMGRKLRTLTPSKLNTLKPKFATYNTNVQLARNKANQKYYHDKSAKPLTELKQQQPVYIQTGHRKWLPGIVKRCHETPRSYIVATPDGSVYRRNRAHLRPRRLFDNENDSTKDLNNLVPNVHPQENGDERVISKEKSQRPGKENFCEKDTNIETDSCKTERPRRTIRKPLRFQDYV